MPPSTAPSPSGERFFSELPSFERFVEVCDPQRYRQAPADWLVVVTDVEGSTEAIAQGRYKDVNALGVASIVALRNGLPDVELPFVFGGDGATFLVPGSRRSVVERTLRGIRVMARDSFELQMRGGLIAVAELSEAGHQVWVARYRASLDVCFAMLAGRGIREAERRIKDPAGGSRYCVSEAGEAEADFSGFECRWRPIASRQGKIMSLLVRALAPTHQQATVIYRELVDHLEEVLGRERPPLAPETLELAREPSAFDQEARVRSGSKSGLAFRMRRARVGVAAKVGASLLRKGRDAFGFPGSRYRDEVIANTDYRKLDDMLRMVLDVTAAQQAQIEAFLQRGHAERKLNYGVHLSDACLMTCAVEQHAGQHMHFVDGADGGYTLAARQLKKQLEAADPASAPLR